MNYLFFDIECANCFNGKGKIYSFGYLITDSDFNIISPPEDILINPDCKFDPYVKKNILVYDRALIKSKPKFDQVYPIIKKLMTQKDTLCFAYGSDNDQHFLADDCERYSLKKIKAKIFDIQKLIKLAENKNARKLSIEFEERFGNLGSGAHRSDVDAVRTMMIAKQVCYASKKALHEYFL
ncbi:MAG: hypothetical protein IJW13_02855 [Clostridia bacterium]|nr:hypothetical protein [Clostridia bacterium]